MSLLAATSETGHGLHVLGALGFLVLVLGGVTFGEAVQRAGRMSREAGGRKGLLPVMAVAGLVAAAVHVLVIPEHVEESTLYGVFFIVVATAQLGYSALVVLRPSPLLLRTGIAANLLLVALWLFTRLVAVPLGPGAGEVEGFGVLDVLCSISEIVVVIAASLALRPGCAPQAAPDTGSLAARRVVA